MYTKAGDPKVASVLKVDHHPKTNWHRLVSAQFPIIYLNTVSLIGARISKINVLKVKKIDNFVSKCSRYRVQPFVLEVLMSSFENTLLEKLPSRRGIYPRGE